MHLSNILIHNFFLRCPGIGTYFFFISKKRAAKNTAARIFYDITTTCPRCTVSE